MDVQTYARLREAGMDKKQARLMAVLTPDRSQFTTQDDLQQLGLAQSHMENRNLHKQNLLILWVAGLLLVVPPLWMWVWAAALPGVMQ